MWSVHESRAVCLDMRVGDAVMMSPYRFIITSLSPRYDNSLPDCSSSESIFIRMEGDERGWAPLLFDICQKCRYYRR